MHSVIKFLIVTIITIFSFHTAFSATPKTVSVLTWENYLSEKTTKLIKDKCNVELSYDTYSSNDNMLRRWHSQEGKYEIIIFSETMFNAIKKDIVLTNSNIWKKSKDYNPIILKNYIKGHYPPNVSFFVHALTGFVWNRKIINLTKNDTVESAFAKVKNNKVILIDDPVEINMLLNAGISNNFENSANIISLSNLKKITKNAQVFVSNDINKIYDQDDFALAIQWSGAAVTTHLGSNNFHFLINDNLSYITTDLIAQIKDTPEAACAANILAGKEYLTDLQNVTGYFSPYGNMEKVPPGSFRELYKVFLKKLPKLHWLIMPSAEQLKKLNQEWNEVKYELSKSNL